MVDDPALIARLSGVKSGLNADFIRENYRQMSFTMAEFLAKKRGVLADMFPAAWRTSKSRWTATPNLSAKGGHLWLTDM